MLTGQTQAPRFQVKKVIKTTTTRTVVPSVSDTLSLDGGGSLTGVGAYAGPMGYRPAVGAPLDYPTNTVPRNYHYGPPVGYNDYRAGPPADAYASLNRSAHMDDRYRWAGAFGPEGGWGGAPRSPAECPSPLQTRPPSPPRWLQNPGPQLQGPQPGPAGPLRGSASGGSGARAAPPGGAPNPLCSLSVQVGRMGSALELSSIPRFVAEPYGLEDDQRSMGFDEPDYGLGHPLHFGTVPRNHHAFPHGPPRRAG